uniref:uncharacterized protein LOC120334407 isoform X2 n=1 Tax=Styela clava TaxID=7725 RepID=UPI00193ACB36|nr:uncharacterized protein LOC120334407 isoform X2 [Styela clava]
MEVLSGRNRNSMKHIASSVMIHDKKGRAIVRSDLIGFKKEASGSWKEVSRKKRFLILEGVIPGKKTRIRKGFIIDDQEDSDIDELELDIYGPPSVPVKAVPFQRPTLMATRRRQCGRCGRHENVPPDCGICVGCGQHPAVARCFSTSSMVCLRCRQGIRSSSLEESCPRCSNGPRITRN